MGTHTYAENGLYTVTNTVGFLGGSYTYTDSTTIPGVSVTVTFGATLAPTVLTPPSTASVTQGTLAVSVFPIVGTEGLPIAPQAIATFIDAGGAGPIGDYSATIDIVSPSGLVTLIPGIVGITQNGDAEQYTVTAPTIPGSAIPESGTYQLEVFVTDSGGATPITVEGAALAVIQDAPLTPSPAVLLSENTGIAFSGTIGGFTDADTFNVATDFTAIIDWGDGSPNSVGIVSGSDGTFTVDGSHTYASSGSGSFTTTITVTETDGSTVVIPGSISVTDLPVIQYTSPSFTSTVGLPTGSFVLFTFEDPNTLATVSDVNATLPIGGWGDDTPTAAGDLLSIQEIGVDPTNGDPIFAVYGSHTYTSVTPPGTPFALSVLITTVEGATTTLSDPPGAGVTVVDAKLTSSNGTEITGIEGISTPDTAPSDVGTLLGSFSSADPSATIANFTSGGGSVVVNWGDGSALQTLDADNLTLNGSPDGVVFTINASHTYDNVGTYAYTMTVTSAGGSQATISGSAIIADAPLTAIPTALIATSESPVYPVPQFGVPVFSGLVGSFSSTDPLLTPGSFTATIDWGDGSPNSAATSITQPEGPGTTFDVYGSHTYASSGVPGYTYPITVFVTETDDNSAVTLTNAAAVAPIPIVITGSILPTSLTGKSGTVDLTNVTSPTFAGTAGPFNNITLYAVPVGTTTGTIIGHTEAGSDGSWSITSSKLAQGQYTILASATDQFGLNATPPVAITTVLNIETTLPVITALSFDRFDATLTVTYQDGLAGMDIPSITNSAFYHLSATPLASNVHVPKLIEPTQIFFTPGCDTVVPDHGRGRLQSRTCVPWRQVRGGHRFRRERYRGPGRGGQSAGWHLLRHVPDRRWAPRRNFVATIFTFHNVTLPFVPGAGYSPPPAGIDPPAGTKLPKTKNHVVVNTKSAPVAHATQKIASKNAKLKAHDDALAELVAASKSKKS